MVIFTLGILPNFKNNRTEAIVAPADRTKLLRFIAPLVHQIDRVENLLRFLQTDAVLPLISWGALGRGYDWVIAALRV